LLIDVDEISLEAFIHYFSNISKVEFKECVKEEHLKTVIIENAFTCGIAVALMLLTWQAQRCLQDLCAPIKELISFSFIKCVDNKTLPQNLELLWLEDTWARTN
jgi:hypothetical protein